MQICNTKNSIRIKKINKEFERGETIVDVGAYVLMSNHFHILIKEKIENGISLYMLKLLTAYSMYFNKKYKRTGRLFEGIFKSSHIATERYLKYLYSYIHLNPAKIINKNWKEVRAKSVNELLKFIFEYRYSSLQEYISPKTQNERKILEIGNFPPYFKSLSDHKNELFGWLSLEE
jgi:REP element-mobilizing transposase RayT